MVGFHFFKIHFLVICFNFIFLIHVQLATTILSITTDRGFVVFEVKYWFWYSQPSLHLVPNLNTLQLDWCSLQPIWPKSCKPWSLWIQAIRVDKPSYWQPLFPPIPPPPKQPFHKTNSLWNHQSFPLKSCQHEFQSPTRCAPTKHDQLDETRSPWVNVQQNHWWSS